MGISHDRWGFLPFHGSNRRWWGFPMIDGDFSGFDGIAIGVEGLFILIGTLMDNGSLFSPFGFLLSQAYIIQEDYWSFPPIVSFPSHQSPLPPFPLKHILTTMSAFVANNAVLNAAATPFTPSFETDAPYDVEQHLYDSPANIAHDNQVAVRLPYRPQCPRRVLGTSWV